MEDITDLDYTHTKRVCKYSKIINLREYDNLYVQSDAPWLADVSSNFQNICLKIYGFHPTHFLSAPRLA